MQCKRGDGWRRRRRRCCCSACTCAVQPVRWYVDCCTARVDCCTASPPTMHVHSIGWLARSACLRRVASLPAASTFTAAAPVSYRLPTIACCAHQQFTHPLYTGPVRSCVCLCTSASSCGMLAWPARMHATAPPLQSLHAAVACRSHTDGRPLACMPQASGRSWLSVSGALHAVSAMAQSYQDTHALVSYESSIRLSLSMSSLVS